MTLATTNTTLSRTILKQQHKVQQQILKPASFAVDVMERRRQHSNYCYFRVLSANNNRLSKYSSSVTTRTTTSTAACYSRPLPPLRQRINFCSWNVGNCGGGCSSSRSSSIGDRKSCSTWLDVRRSRHCQHRYHHQLLPPILISHLRHQQQQDGTQQKRLLVSSSSSSSSAPVIDKQQQQQQEDVLSTNPNLIPFYVVRHGETDYNKELRIQGVTDIALNSKGRLQAQLTAQAIKDQVLTLANSASASPIKVNIFTSLMSRASETGDAIYDALVKMMHNENNGSGDEVDVVDVVNGVSLERSSHLNEWNLGCLEGLTRQDALTMYPHDWKIFSKWSDPFVSNETTTQRISSGGGGGSGGGGESMEDVRRRVVKFIERQTTIVLSG